MNKQQSTTGLATCEDILPETLFDRIGWYYAETLSCLLITIVKSKSMSHHWPINVILLCNLIACIFTYRSTPMYRSAHTHHLFFLFFHQIRMACSSTYMLPIIIRMSHIAAKLTDRRWCSFRCFAPFESKLTFANEMRFKSKRFQSSKVTRLNKATFKDMLNLWHLMEVAACKNVKLQYLFTFQASASILFNSTKEKRQIWQIKKCWLMTN
jgi:hypothetical protein